MTDNYERRLLQHNNGLTSSTKSFIPWIIVLIEEFKSREKARLREKYLKSAAGRRWRKNNIIWPRGATE
ncbi:MAG: GIY-YIG nuclease family protein [Bacteroidetes bacterium]|nr:GIY-YIG nuclease family protein [Bacteroidota bacterium]